MKPIRPIVLAGTALPFVLAAALSATACEVTDAKYRSYYGKPSDPTAAQREILIKPDTRSVNVTAGQVVRFAFANGADSAFAWNFDTWGGRVAQLDRLAPDGVKLRPIKVYIGDDPRYGG